MTFNSLGSFVEDMHFYEIKNEIKISVIQSK